jgi:flagellin-like protein
MKNKKGISAIVATVLIILITVAAVTIIWAAIIPMINNQLDKGTVCLDAVSQLTLVDAGYTCKNIGTGAAMGNISIQLKHGAKDFALGDVQVLVSAGGDTQSKKLVADMGIPATSLPGSNEEKVFLVLTSGNFTGNAANASKIDKIEIAPIVKVGNTQETCDVSSSKVLLKC